MNIAPLPSAPKFVAPPGSANCHAHVMGPFDKFPLPPRPGYMPPLAPVENYVAGLDRMGLQYGVFVQSSSHGKDSRVLLDALARYPRLRGVGLAEPSISDADLQVLAEAGVRGLRFTGSPYPGHHNGHAGSSAIFTLFEMAPRLKAFGMHAQLWMHCDQTMELSPRLLKLGIPIVLDHMGRFDTGSGLAHPGFQNLLTLLKTGQVWIKLIPQRNSDNIPDYPDVRPFQDALIAANPDRLVWGTDWPHTNTPPELVADGGKLLDLFAEWVTDAGLRKKILADNAQALYGFRTG
jgi:predicted TIM-barrel fold metal-dependent hydrolase